MNLDINSLVTNHNKNMKGILRRYNKPKVSISKIIEIYEYYKARKAQRYSEYREFFDSKILPILESGTLEIPFSVKDDDIYVYNYSRHNFGKIKSWGYSSNIVRPVGRENRLDYILLSNSELLELGKELHFHNRRSDLLFSIIKSILIGNLTQYCRDNVDNYDRIIFLNIEGKKFTMIKESPYEAWSRYELVENISDIDTSDFLSTQRNSRS